MKYLAVICLISLASASFATEVSDQEWEEFKQKFNKVYDAQEDVWRRDLYLQKKIEVEEHNKKYEAGEVSFSMELNKFSDLTTEELKKLLGFGTLSVRAPVQARKIQTFGFELPEGVSIDEQWQAYKEYFNRQFDAEEDLMRKNLFIESLNRVTEHNKRYEKGEVTWTAGLNQFSDRTPEELKQMTGFIPRP